MFESAPAPQDPAAAANDEATDSLVALAERRLRWLGELAEIGMELARALRPGAAPAGEAAANDKAQGKMRDPADAFAPLSRAIRLTLALEARTAEELRDLRAGVVKTREAEQFKAVDDAAKAREAHQMRVQARVHSLVIAAAEPQCESGDEVLDLWEALDERLEEDEAYGDIDKWPLRETVERLCKDLNVTPDWSRWDGEGWIENDPPLRPRHSRFHTPSARPLMNSDGAPLEAPAHSPRLGGNQALE